MNMTLQDTRKILIPFTTLFPLPTNASFDALVVVWFSLLKDRDAGEVVQAGKRLAMKLTRFPFPSDFFAEIEAAKQSTTAASAEGGDVQSAAQ